MALNPKDNEFIYGTPANAAMRIREQREAARQKQFEKPPVRRIQAPRPLEPFAGPAKTRQSPLAAPHQPATPTRPAGTRAGGSKPVALNILCAAAGFVAAVFASAHGVKSLLGLAIAFAVTFVAAQLLARYIKVLGGIAILVFLLYEVIRHLASR